MFSSLLKPYWSHQLPSTFNDDVKPKRKKDIAVPVERVLSSNYFTTPQGEEYSHHTEGVGVGSGAVGDRMFICSNEFMLGGTALWSSEEDEKLLQAVRQLINDHQENQENGNNDKDKECDIAIDWRQIADKFTDPLRSSMDLLVRYRNVINPTINKEKLWSKREEADLHSLADAYECRDWALIAEELGTNRTAFDCLKHYQMYLNPLIFTQEPWTIEEDDALKTALKRFGSNNTKIISSAFPDRTVQSCSQRREKLALDERDEQLPSGPFSDQEERILFMAGISMGLVPGKPTNPTYFSSVAPSSISASSSAASVSTTRSKSHAELSTWTKLAPLVPDRTVNQCRDRWLYAFDPKNNFAPFTADEVLKASALIDKHGVGNWTRIAAELPGRSVDIMKRYWLRNNKEAVKTLRIGAQKRKIVLPGGSGRVTKRNGASVLDKDDFKISYAIKE